MRSFALVASALGDRFRVRVRIAGERAFTDGDLVVLPQLPDDSEYAEVAWGYLVHEAAHLRFTDFNLKQIRCDSKPELYFHLWNILEDLRIELALAALYPGVPRMLRSVVASLVKDGTFKAVSAEEHPGRVLTGYLLYAGRCEVVGQTLLTEIAAETERSLRTVFPSIADDLHRILVKAGAAQSTAETLDLADEVYALLDRLPEPEESSNDSRREEGDDDPQGSGEAGDRAATPRNGHEPDDDQGDGADDSPGEDDEPDGKKGAEGARDTDSGGSAGDGQSAEDPDHTSDDSMDGQSDHECAVVASAQNDGDDSRNGGSAGASANSASDQSVESSPTSGERHDSSAAADEAAGDASPGSSEDGSEAKSADEAKAYSSSAHGSLQSDLGELMSAALEDAASAYGNDARDGPTLEEVIPIMDADPVWDDLADWLFVAARSHSVSLRRGLLSILESRARTQRWCVEQGRRVKASRLSRLRAGDGRVFEKRFTRKAVNTAITLLVDTSSSMNQHGRMQLAKESCVALSLAIEAIKNVALEVLTFPYGSHTSLREGFGLVKGFGEKSVVMKPRLARIRAKGCTPMAPAILTAGVRLLRRPEPRKVMLVLTDGQPDSIELTRQAIETMHGIEIVGIGIECGHVAQVFKEFVVIDDVAELPRQLLIKARELIAA